MGKKELESQILTLMKQLNSQQKPEPVQVQPRPEPVMLRPEPEYKTP